MRSRKLLAGVTWRRILPLAAGALALLLIVTTVGIREVIRDVALAGWALPAMIAIHVAQLFLSALAWRWSLGGAGMSARGILRARWVREGVNTLLPLAQIGGQVAGIHLLVKAGVAPALAVAATVLDLTLEAASQLIFTLGGLGVLVALGRSHGWLAWMGGGLGLTLAGVAGLVAAQRLGLLRLIEQGLERSARTWPVVATWSLGGLHAALMARQADMPAMARALAAHTLSWALGGLEVWVALLALRHPVGLAGGVVIESVGMAARSAGFVVPGAVGVQEGGFVLVCGLFGVPAEVAVALSVLKRVRELVIAVPAVQKV